eukprot:6199897-Pleurochrysis_carterae.AAC.1
MEAELQVDSGQPPALHSPETFPLFSVLPAGIANFQTPRNNALLDHCQLSKGIEINCPCRLSIVHASLNLNEMKDINDSLSRTYASLRCSYNDKHSLAIIYIR